MKFGPFINSELTPNDGQDLYPASAVPASTARFQAFVSKAVASSVTAIDA